VEAVIRVLLIAGSTIAIFTTIGIVLSVLFEAIRFFQKVPITEFLFGLKWSPQVAIRADQVGGSGAFGAVPLFTGTLLISGIAMAVAVPIGLMSAIYLSEYASRGFRTIAKPVLEVLAGIPTGGVWLLCRAGRRPSDPGYRHRHRVRRVLGERAGGGVGDGHHDHPVRVFPRG